MAIFWTIVLILMAALAAHVVIACNGLVRARQMARAAWSGIDVQLERLANLIPNLVESVK